MVPDRSGRKQYLKSCDNLVKSPTASGRHRQVPCLKGRSNKVLNLKIDCRNVPNGNGSFKGGSNVKNSRRVVRMYSTQSKMAEMKLDQVTAAEPADKTGVE
jgi:hypothetical protein